MREDDMLRLSMDVAATVVRGDHYAATLADGVSQMFRAAVIVGGLDVESTGVRVSSVAYAECLALSNAELCQAFQGSVGHPIFKRPAWLAGIAHAARVTDCVDLARFGTTALYQQVHGPMERQGSGRFPAAVLLGRSVETTIWMGITRRTDLTDEEMAVLDVLIDGPVVPALRFRFAWDQAVRRVEGVARSSGGPRLSARESETLGLVALGWTNARIARHLRISERTVRKHLENVNDKLGTANRAAAVIRWRDLRL